MAVCAGGFGSAKVKVTTLQGLPEAADAPDSSLVVKLLFGGRTKRTTLVPQAGSEAQVNCVVQFPVSQAQAALEVEVLRISEAGEEASLGKAPVEIGGSAKQTLSVALPEPNIGEVGLEVEYDFKEVSDPTENSLGKLELEVVKAKALPAEELADIPVTSYVAVELGPFSAKTKTVKESANPFYNALYEYEIFDLEDECQFAVCDDSGKVVGRCSLTVDFTDSKGAKAAEWLRLNLEGASAGEESTSSEAPNNAEIFVRYKFTPKKKKAAEGDKKAVDEDDIDLGYVPVITGEIGFIPDIRFYVWQSLLEDRSFRNRVVAKILQSFTKKEKKAMGMVELPYSSMDDLIENGWKCKTRLRLFNKFRTCAHQFVVDGSVVVSPEEEQKLWQNWKKYAVMRQEIAKDFKVEKALKELYNVVMLGGSENPETERKGKGEKRITKKTHAIFCQHLYRAFVPDLSGKLARKIAAEDFNRYDAEACENSENHFLFVKLLKDFAGFWCETLTEFEYRTFLNSIMPVLANAYADTTKVSADDPKKAKRGSKVP
eukprot:RCo053253